MNCPLPFKLKTSDATIYDVPEKFKNNFKGLVISDHHFGLKMELQTSLSIFKSKLEQIIKNLNPTCLFMLGDTIDFHASNFTESIKIVFNYLEKLEIPIFLLGGNHDKERILKLNYKFEKNLIFVKDTFIRIQHPKSTGEKYTGILMGHDLGNNFAVLYDDAPTFVKWMREVFDRYFKPGQMMLIGHMHKEVSLNEYDSYSIKQFSPDFHVFQYAIIHDNGNSYGVSFLNL